VVYALWPDQRWRVIATPYCSNASIPQRSSPGFAGHGRQNDTIATCRHPPCRTHPAKQRRKFRAPLRHSCPTFRSWTTTEAAFGSWELPSPTNSMTRRPASALLHGCPRCVHALLDGRTDRLPRTPNPPCPVKERQWWSGRTEWVREPRFAGPPFAAEGVLSPRPSRAFCLCRPCRHEQLPATGTPRALEEERAIAPPVVSRRLSFPRELFVVSAIPERGLQQVF
jgi:hypothetical protein